MRDYTRRSLLHKTGSDYVQVILEMNDRAERVVLNQDNSTSTLHLEQPNSAWSMMTSLRTPVCWVKYHIGSSALLQQRRRCRKVGKSTA